MLIFIVILPIIIAIYTLVMITMLTIILKMIIQHHGISPLESSSQYCYTDPNNYFWAGLCLDNLRHKNSYLSICLPFLMNFCQCCSVMFVYFLFFQSRFKSRLFDLHVFFAFFKKYIFDKFTATISCMKNFFVYLKFFLHKFLRDLQSFHFVFKINISKKCVTYKPYSLTVC